MRAAIALASNPNDGERLPRAVWRSRFTVANDNDMKKHYFLGKTFSISKSKKFRLLPKLELVDAQFNAYCFSWFGFMGWLRDYSTTDERIRGK